MKKTNLVQTYKPAYTRVMKYCGIDYGTKRIGVALSNTEGTIAFPEIVLENTNDVIDKIISITKEHDIDSFVIGESLMGNGQENIINPAIKKFAKKIEEGSGKKVHFQNEWGSSVMATAHHYGKGNIAMERWSGKSNKKKREHNDAHAATIILQRYLDAQKVI
ncbi:Holliday junction resolvase RuvX [Candidatus Campbellbacteria bacterium]|nr:Holliday junction resolvase RuvX [Candidatus Campbellbacteria bacterium]|tara:strand:- start:1192 stop:1680 length:489 start_codon:yes stop_codon:yes gene_type:complete